jgi:hypothetical protein
MDRGPRTYNHDFPDLFDAAPRWSVRADAFKLSPKFVAQASEESIRHVTDFLTSHHIAIVADTGGVQMDSPTPVPGECGYGVEGYARPGRNQIVFNRWKRLGREVQYINFDEPLSFGHHYHGKNACNFSKSRNVQRYPLLKFASLIRTPRSWTPKPSPPPSPALSGSVTSNSG